MQTKMLFFLLSSCILPSASSLSFQTVDFPGSAFNVANGKNKSGELVGFHDVGGFLLSGGIFSTIMFRGSIQKRCPRNQ